MVEPSDGAPSPDEPSGSAEADDARELAAVATLASGIAHNFNNLLMAMLPNIEMCQPHLDAEQQAMLDDALDAGHRAASIVKKLLLFAGHASGSPAIEADGGELVERLIAAASERFAPGTTLRLIPGNAPTPCKVRPEPLMTALGALLDNAYEACAGREGEVRIGARAAMQVAPDAGGEARRWICFFVEDDGGGMAPEVAARAVEPFFTTKVVGQGAGLGLATAHGVARAHGGWLALRSTPGQGTRASLYVPAAP